MASIKEKQFPSHSFAERLSSMFRVDARRMFGTPLFWICLGTAFAVPILVLVMTSSFGGGGGAMFTNTWQIIGSESASLESMMAGMVRRHERRRCGVSGLSRHDGHDGYDEYQPHVLYDGGIRLPLYCRGLPQRLRKELIYRPRQKDRLCGVQNDHWLYCWSAVPSCLLPGRHSRRFHGRAAL